MRNLSETIASRVTARPEPAPELAGKQHRPAPGNWVSLCLVIVLDATESMQPCIDGARQALYGMLDILDKSKISAKLGSVIFRDELIGEEANVTPLGVAPEALKNLLRSTRAEGGGDEPESSLPALMKAVDLLSDAAQGASRMILHITDARPHDPEGSLTAASVRDALLESRAIYLGCTPAIEPYKTFANVTGGTLFTIHSGLDAESFGDILESVAHASVHTIRQGEAGISDDTRKILEGI